MQSVLLRTKLIIDKNYLFSVYISIEKILREQFRYILKKIYIYITGLIFVKLHIYIYIYIYTCVEVNSKNILFMTIFQSSAPKFFY